MHSVLETALIYLCLLCGIARHGSCVSTCACPETCASGIKDQPPMSCLSRADHSSLTARRLPNEAVCSNYATVTDSVTQETHCEFAGRQEPIADMCQSDGSFCIIQNPNQKQHSCQKEHFFCNYLVQCPPGQLLWLQCGSMDLPDFDQNGECKDEVTLLSPNIVNGKQSVCGSTCFSHPIISPDSIEIKYGSSHCCHNHGFHLFSFCSTPVGSQPVKRDTSMESYSDDEGMVEVPEGGKLQYLDQTIYITFPSEEVIMFKDIQVLFIEDNLKGNSVYTGTGVEALYGRGSLEIVGYVAYYHHTTTDPRLLPNAAEIEYITRSVNMLSDIVSAMTYSSWRTHPPPDDDSGYDLEELLKGNSVYTGTGVGALYGRVLQEALDQEESSMNPFVLGIARDLIACLGPILADK